MPSGTGTRRIRRRRGRKSPQNARSPIRNWQAGKSNSVASKLHIFEQRRRPPFPIEGEINAAEGLVCGSAISIYVGRSRTVPRAAPQLILEIRKVMDELGFLEVENAMLTRSTRKERATFWCPAAFITGSFTRCRNRRRSFKQILMIAGMDKYFQIVKCFGTKICAPTGSSNYTTRPGNGRSTAGRYFSCNRTSDGARLASPESKPSALPHMRIRRSSEIWQRQAGHAFWHGIARSDTVFSVRRQRKTANRGQCLRLSRHPERRAIRASTGRVDREGQSAESARRVFVKVAAEGLTSTVEN